MKSETTRRIIELRLETQETLTIRRSRRTVIPQQENSEATDPGRFVEFSGPTSRSAHDCPIEPLYSPSTDE